MIQVRILILEPYFLVQLDIDVRTNYYRHMPYKDRNKQKSAQHEHYLKNKDKYYAARRKARTKRIEIINKIKSVPCADCGIQYPPPVMEFDHIKGTKTDNVGSMLLRYSIEKILDEISKCEVVCANCHRLRTMKRYAKRG